MIRKITLILILSFNLIYSQQVSENRTNDYIVKFSALDLLTGFHFQSSTLQFGLEKGLSKYYSINTELGYSLNINRQPNLITIDLDNSSGFTIESEIRKYLGNENADYTGHYFSIDVIYRYLEAKDHHTVNESFDPDNIYNWSYGIEEYSTFRNEYAIHIKYGYQNITALGFVTDFSIGCGWRYITSKSNNSYPIYFIEYEFPYKKPFVKGNKSFFSLTAAIRIGLSIK